MPLRSELLGQIFLENQVLLEEIFNTVEDICIKSDFNLLDKQNNKTKTDFYDIILNNIKYEIPNKAN